MSFGSTFARTTRPVVMGRRGAVVSGHHLASQAALEMLQAGGNAVDAAITAAAALAVLKPDACALGSDLFMLYGEAESGETYALNASGPAPRLAGREAFNDGKIPTHGARASSVPGAVDAWHRAVTRFGRKPLAQALAPAIALARDGMPVSALFAASLAKNAAGLREFPATAAIFLPDGNVPAAGQPLVQRDLARTLEAIAQGGPDAYYRGDFAKALDAYQREHDGFMRAEDLAAYESQWRTPLTVPYRGYELVAQPPVSMGIIVLEALKILENFPLVDEPDASADAIHRHAEAMKLAMSDQVAYVGDPDFARHHPVQRLIGAEYAAERAQSIDMRRAHAFRAGDIFAQAGSDTSYVAAIDADGNAVSLLQSVFHVFGSFVVVPGTGCLMNNRMTGFSLDPASPNVLEPGKRTMHTLNPAMVRKDGKTVICLGTPGGPSQTHTNVELLIRLLDRGLDVQSAIDAPRWFATLANVLNIESSVGREVLDDLAGRGHEIAAVPKHSAAMGGAGAIRINDFGMREAGADPRRETYALAY